MKVKNILSVFLFVLCLEWTLCAPDSLVLTTSTGSEKTETKEGTTITKPVELIIYEFGVNSTIHNRYSKTLITSKIKNPDDKAKEATFSVVLPEKAFISEFVMEIKGETYKAYVKEKEEAKNIYNKAVESGLSAGHVAISARDSNRFTVSVNVEPETKAVFLLTYEELLERKNNQYELILNIHPGQIVKDLHVEVFINETRPLKFVQTPALRSGNEISKNDNTLNPSSHIEIINKTSAIVKFKPDVDEQKTFIKGLGGKETEGLTGQFIVQYDVERDPHGEEVLLQDGYFVHFFAPDDLPPLPEHVVFILDTSGSMYGTKLKQLKDAMISILGELEEKDMFHIVEFNTKVYVWNIETQTRDAVNITNDDVPYEDVLKATLPPAVFSTKENIANGITVIKKLQDDGITNMLSSLVTGLHLAKSTQEKQSENVKRLQPIIIFLTDGDPTAGIINTDEITNITSELNARDNKVPIYSLSFGDGADKSFLRKLSLRNLGFSRHIYEAADASLQLQNFYKEISSPLLSNVHFKYDSEVKEVSRKDFPIFFRGSELVTVGKYEGSFASKVEGLGIDGFVTVPSIVTNPVSSIERLWAYLTIKQKLEQREITENQTQLTQEALDLALRYSFVTDVSSLVVVKPNDTSAVNTVDASKPVYADFSSGVAIGLRFEDDMDDLGFNLFGGMDKDFDQEELGTSVFYDAPTYMDMMLPWLKTTLNSNDTLTISGKAYELGADVVTYLPAVDCPKIPTNDTEAGECVLLKQCPMVFSRLNTFEEYKKYFCPLDNDKYAGVCCPK